MKSMQKNIVKYSALVFIGGASYGVMATALKMAYAAGFAWQQTVASQALFGALIFGVALLVTFLFGARPVKLGPRRIAALMGLGLTTCTTCILYNFALSRLPVAVALTLLFQFTWIGVVIQVVTTRRRPHAAELVAVVLILGGTVLASSLLSAETTALDPLGVAAGALSAVSTAAFMYLSSRIGTDLPPIQRGLFVCLGASVLGLLVCPTYFSSGVLAAGIWKYGFVLGLFALFIPVIAFGLGTPHLLPGISTILASAELPCGILLSVFILGEAIDAAQTLGVVVILAGVAVAQIPQFLEQRETAPANPEV